MKNEQLKPCPFCGKQPYVAEEMEPDDWWSVACQTPGCVLPSAAGHTSIESAIDAWNRRAAPVAPAAAPVNLEGLRKKLLTPRKILRDAQGFLTHPDYPICDEGTRTDTFLAAFGIETRFGSMEDDLPDLHERWCDEGLDDCSEWTPTPPEGDGWLLLEIYDTEDGPYAMFGRDQYEAENALKRQRMRAQLDRIQQLEADKGAAQ